MRFIDIEANFELASYLIKLYKDVRRVQSNMPEQVSAFVNPLTLKRNDDSVVLLLQFHDQVKP